MDMIAQILGPGMKYLDDAGFCSEILPVSGQFQKCFGAASVQQTVKQLLVAVDQRVQFVGKCKDDMEVRGVDDFRASFIHPYFFLYRLAVRTVPVPAGIIVDLSVAAVAAVTDVASVFPGLAVKDRMGSLLLYIRPEDAGGSEFRVRVLPDIPDVIHEDHRRSHQEDS